jgi:kynureninase
LLLALPARYGPRPRDAGWFAEFGTLATAGKGVGYPQNGARFLGATFDPVGVYRMHAVLTWMAENNIGIAQVHEHATELMTHFLERLAPLHLKGLTRLDLITPFDDGAAHGNFLSFRASHAAAIERALAAADIHADHRGDRMRFGFGLATTIEDVEAAIARMSEALAAL